MTAVLVAVAGIFVLGADDQVVFRPTGEHTKCLCVVMPLRLV